MNAEDLLTLASAAAGAVGTGFLFWGTFGLENVPGIGLLGQPTVIARNSSHKFRQRIGLAFLLLAFVLEGASAFV